MRIQDKVNRLRYWDCGGFSGLKEPFGEFLTSMLERGHSLIKSMKDSIDHGLGGF